MRLTLAFSISLLFSLETFSQTEAYGFHELNVQPFTANFLEPKAGFLICLEEKRSGLISVHLLTFIII
jgi:hypothetical protein